MVEELGALLLLALTDSLSFGTLLVPVWLLMAPGRLRAQRILLYLAAVAGTYLLIGLALVLGGRALLDGSGDLLESRPALVARLIVGVTLLVLSFALDTKAARARAAERQARTGRVQRWRDRATRGDGPLLPLIGLAVAAVLIEVVSMLPYLAAIGIVTTAAPSWGTTLSLLAGYCGVMIAPALLLTGARVVARRAVDDPLRRLDGWLTRNARSTTLWIVGILGFILVGSAVTELDLISAD